MRTARMFTMCLIAALVCPSFGEIAGLAAPTSCSSQHACCRRAAAPAPCPHQMPAAAAHDARCHGSICVLTCNKRHQRAVAPVVVIGFVPAAAMHAPLLAATRAAVVSNGAASSFVSLPHTPPPRTI